jgi:hypothetical protein
MAQSFVQVPPSSTGPAVELWPVTGANSQIINRQGVVVTDPTNTSGVQAVKAGGIAPNAATDGASVVTVRDAVTVSNPVTSAAVGGGAFNTGVTSVTGVSGAATSILAARTGGPGTGRIKVILTNNSTHDVVIGNANTMTTGYTLPAMVSTAATGASVTIDTQAQIFGFVSSGSANVSYVEIF